MKIILIITLLVIFTTGCSNSNNTEEKETTAIVQEDKFIKETVSKENILEDITHGDATSNIKDYETPLEEALNNQSQNKEPMTDIVKLEKWDCSSFIDIETPAELEIYVQNTEGIENTELIELLEEEAQPYTYLIKELCKRENIDLAELRLRTTNIYVSTDSKYIGYSIQSNKYYINIAYNSSETKMCYEIIKR